mmetsp:Transcript_158705/g.281323  ORF Transcript_158705/g.281323 Transcript_158705/m.281323 type:complete len:106 (+) Transcript_158705:134-451(+)
MYSLDMAHAALRSRTSTHDPEGMVRRKGAHTRDLAAHPQARRPGTSRMVDEVGVHLGTPMATLQHLEVQQPFWLSSWSPSPGPLQRLQAEAQPPPALLAPRQAGP